MRPEHLVRSVGLAYLALAACASGPAEQASPGAFKPIATVDKVAAAAPLLAEFVAGRLPGLDLGGGAVKAARLLSAKPFAEGHVNETWFLVVDVDGVQTKFALKIFPTAEGAEVNHAQLLAAQSKGWRVPAEHYRGPVAPYTDRHGIVMEFIPGGSLASNVANKVAAAGEQGPDVEAIAGMYGAVARVLGRLHEANRKQATGLRTAGAQLRGLASRCAEGGWCGADVKARLEALAPALDTGPVTFTHGDLYEQQIIMREDGDGLAAFIDLDLARYDDAAADVGAMMAHILLINTRARKATQGVPDASAGEAKATADRFLAEYRKGAWMGDEEWAAFATRVRGHTYLRMGELLNRYARNPHARALMDVLEAQRKDLFTRDPFEAFGVTL